VIFGRPKADVLVALIIATRGGDQIVEAVRQVELALVEQIGFEPSTRESLKHSMSGADAPSAWQNNVVVLWEIGSIEI
jgi:hypothetical protein